MLFEFVKKIAKVVAIYKEELIIVKQLRNSSQGHTYELPGEKINENEEIKQGATRELKEETELVTNSRRLSGNG